MAGLQIGNGATVGIGSLPHRDLDAGVRFALDATAIPTIPSLPRRSTAEGIIVQAMLGIEGVTVGQYGAISVDIDGVDPIATVTTDLQHDAFAGVRRFLELAAERHADPDRGPIDAVKWQHVGPVTLGMALLRAGVPLHDAFEVSVRAVRAHVQHLLDAVETALPGCRQLVFIDEPDMVDLTDAHFPIAPDTAIDLVSGALAAIESRGMSGLHVCGVADWSTMISTGPKILSIPVDASIVESAGYLQQFLARGGIVAWGAVHTDGPISTTVERPWRQLTQLWCRLVERGCDHVMLRTQCLITPRVRARDALGVGRRAGAPGDR